MDKDEVVVTLCHVNSTGEPDREEADREEADNDVDHNADQPSPSLSPVSKSSDWMKHAGLGIELAGTTIGVGLIGYAIDWKMQNETPYATALAGLIGFSFAMFRFIQNVTRENH